MKKYYEFVKALNIKGKPILLVYGFDLPWTEIDDYSYDEDKEIYPNDHFLFAEADKVIRVDSYRDLNFNRFDPLTNCNIFDILEF